MPFFATPFDAPRLALLTPTSGWRPEAAFAAPGTGQVRGFRSIVLFRRGSKAFFVYGFAKNDRDNIDRQELKAFRLLADQMLALDDKAIERAMKNGTIAEVDEHG